MTKWLPQLKRDASPVYRAIADALAGDIASGRLEPGTRLPTHRDLAWQLGVTVGTISRAYTEAERRGLIGGEIGRGTFVLPARPDWVPSQRPEPPAGFIDLTVNYAIVGDEARLLAESIAELAQRHDLDQFLHYRPHAGGAEDREVGAEWLCRTGLEDATPASTIVTNGGQHGIAILLSALARPGDCIAVEQLTYPVFKAAAYQLGLQPTGVAMDEAGLLPEALDAACRARTIRLLYTMPTFHNPTTVTMPQERRRELAAVCRRHDLVVIEDDVYGFLSDPPQRALATLMPERCFYISSTSKAFAPGLRLGYLHVPLTDRDRVIGALRTSTYMAAPLMAALASRWISNGVGDRLAAEKRQLAERRNRVAQGIIGAAKLGTVLHADPASLHCWLTLPPGWRADEFTAAAQRAGVGVTPAAAFAVGTSVPEEAIRICLGIAPTATVLEQALHTIAGLLAGTPGAYLSVV